MNIPAYIGQFFRWITFRQRRLEMIQSAQLQLAEQQKQAEVFALEQSLRTLESERDDLKAQIVSIEKSHGYTKEFLEDERQLVIKLQKDLEHKDVVIDRFRTAYDSLKRDFDLQKTEIARLETMLKDRP
jgi:chromosome segregation ATPase